MMTKTKTNAEEHRRREKAHRVWDEGKRCNGGKERGENVCATREKRAIPATGKEKEGEGTHQNDHFGNDHHPGSAKRRYREETEEKEKEEEEYY